MTRIGERFLGTLGEACGKTGWQVHALCLMPNHFHLVVETPQANLVAGMKWFLGTYTGRFNRRHKLFGHLFSGRYKALIVDGSGNGYLKTVCDYVHLNPVRAKLLDAGAAVAGISLEQLAGVFEASGATAGVVAGGPVAGGVSAFRKDSAAGRRQLEAAMEQRRAAESGSGLQGDAAGLVFGSGDVSEGVAGADEERLGAEHYGEERQETVEANAEGIVAGELKRRGWSRDGVGATRPKGTRGKWRSRRGCGGRRR